MNIVVSVLYTLFVVGDVFVEEYRLTMHSNLGKCRSRIPGILDQK
jgi:hypothetical protein